ncbi:MAG: class I SAM-dependent methyltransferase [Archangium sp.]
MTTRLTTQSQWDDYWKGTKLPLEVRRGANRADDAILEIIERHVPLESASVVEVGGAPGQFLAYFAAKHHVTPHVLDYSEIGCAKTTENFRLLGHGVTVHQRDLFADPLPGPFDLVFSLGLIEHFGDLNAVVARHVAMVRPGGWLVIGCPNFTGVNHWFMKRLAPALLAEHNLATMHEMSWDGFERELSLRRVFRGYIGGFEPALFFKSERGGVRAFALTRAARLARRVLPAPLLQRLGGREFSQYLLGVYQRPVTQ